jgi:acetyl esterase/lipase
MKDVSFVAPKNNSEQVLTYKIVGDHECNMLYYPPTEQVFDRAPVYVIIPGGGWHSAVAIDMANFSMRSSTALRARGWAVVSLSYRVAPVDGVKMQDIVSDCMDACRYLARFADALGIDPHRIVTSGHSAGGHLALMLAYAPHRLFSNASPYDAQADDFTVIGTAPLSAPTILYKDESGYCPQGFAYADVFEESDRLVADLHFASPFDYITPAAVPTLMVCGTHDIDVFPENSTRFYEKCRSMGAPCEILYSHFGGHCFESRVEGRESYVNFAQVQDHLIDFITGLE